MGKLDQANRMGALKTPFDQAFEANYLVLKSFSGMEGLGEPFEFDIDALSEHENVNFNIALGQACTVRLTTYEQKERFFCGILTHAQWVGSEIGGESAYSRYRLVLRPWFWLLNHSANCRIFLGKNVKQIIEKVFTDLQFSSGKDFEFRTTADYDKIKYCVQYRESDFAFVSRLMEQYGIYYYFEHKDGQHMMVLVDSLASHREIPELPKVNYHVQTWGYNRVEQQIDSWISDRRFCTGTFRLKDYDYLEPTKKMEASQQMLEGYERDYWEVYDYPGKYEKQEKGVDFARIRLEAEQALDQRRYVGGDAASLFPGGLVTVNKHPTSSENKKYLVVRATHHFGTQSYGSAGAGSAAGYNGSYEFLPSDRQFRVLPVTPKPRIQGIQTAMVVSKEDKQTDTEEISTDEHGHIWVKFYWDRESDKKSCPIRVSQSWASNGWGEQFIPRIGMEVVVEFLEGDPDRPLVTGCVYNGCNKHPYKLPDNKTQSGVKSDSSKGHNGYNEFMFEDRKGSEVIRMHAQRNHNVTVLHDETWTIGNDRTATLKEGNDVLKLEQGNYLAKVENGAHYTVAQEILETGDRWVTLQITDQGVTSLRLDTGGITAQAPEFVRIQAPTVVITGNLWVQGMIGMGPMCLPVT